MGRDNKQRKKEWTMRELGLGTWEERGGKSRWDYRVWSERRPREVGAYKWKCVQLEESLYELGSSWVWRGDLGTDVYREV